MGPLHSIRALPCLLFVVAIAAVGCRQDAGTDPGGSLADGAPQGPLPGPRIDRIEPREGTVGSEVSLRGAGFGEAEEAGAVDLGGTPAEVLSWSDDEIVFEVPDLLPAGVEVAVTTAAAQDAGSLPFRVILPPMLYINNGMSDAGDRNSLTVMRFDPTTRSLHELEDSPVLLGGPAKVFGGCMNSAYVHQATRRLFVTNATSIDVFDIDPRTGELSPVPGTPFSAGSGQSTSIAVSESGDRVFIAHFDQAVSVHDVAADGSLTPVSGSPFSTATAVDVLALSSSGEFLYGNNETGGFEGYAIGEAGALSPLEGGPFEAGTFAFTMARRPGTDQLFITDAVSGLFVYEASRDTGMPVLTQDAPFDAAPPEGTGLLHHMAFSRQGDRVYIGTDNSGYILGYDLDVEGAPTALAGSPFDFADTATDLSCLHLTRHGRHLIGLDEGQKRVHLWDLDRTGAPAVASGSPFSLRAEAEDASGLAATF